MPLLSNFQGGQAPGFSPLGFGPPSEGLMANPSSFQFMQSMLNQPGSQYGAGNIPDFGTGMNFGVPQYYPQMQPFRGLPPVVPSAGGGGEKKFMDAFRRGGARGGDGGPGLGMGKRGRDKDKSSPGSEATSEH